MVREGLVGHANRRLAGTLGKRPGKRSLRTLALALTRLSGQNPCLAASPLTMLSSRGILCLANAHAGPARRLPPFTPDGLPIGIGPIRISR
jgi:hypothetical protein